MKTTLKNIHWLAPFAVAAAILANAGCHSKSPEKQNKDFFTSGSREADQRASQTMATPRRRKNS